MICKSALSKTPATSNAQIMILYRHMRNGRGHISFLKHRIQARLPGADVRLFGSCADDNKRGGDIDILVVGDTRPSLLDRVTLKAEFHRAFGMRKIDIASFSRAEPSAFRDAVSRDPAIPERTFEQNP